MTHCYIIYLTAVDGEAVISAPGKARIPAAAAPAVRYCDYVDRTAIYCYIGIYSGEISVISSGEHSTEGSGIERHFVLGVCGQKSDIFVLREGRSCDILPEGNINTGSPFSLETERIVFIYRSKLQVAERNFSG